MIKKTGYIIILFIKEPYPYHIYLYIFQMLLH